MTWLHSYVSADRQITSRVYDAPSPEAIRRTATRDKLPVDSITEVRGLDSYFDRWRQGQAPRSNGSGATHLGR